MSDLSEPAKARTTLLQLARHLGLSRTTVSVVISGAEAAKSIPLETQKRILDAASELGYRPNFLASSLRRQRSMSVGVLVAEIGEGYLALVMNGIERYLLDAHYFYFTASHNWKPELLENYPRMLEQRAVEGLLFVNTPIPEAVHVPCVAVSGHKRRACTTNVILNHERAAFLALKHLHDLGHRRIAFMKGQSFTADGDVRWQSIERIAGEMGISIDPHLCITLTSNTWSPELGYEPVRALVARRRDFTALFCFNDTSAMGAMRALHECGLKVPHDVSVIGFDDVVGARFCTPSLTTVRQPLWSMGQTAAKALLDRIAQPRDGFEEILMEPELAIRESTAPAPRLGR